MAAINTLAAACGMVALGVFTGANTAPSPDPNLVARTLVGASTNLEPATSVAPVCADWTATAPAVDWHAAPMPLAEVRANTPASTTNGVSFLVGQSAHRALDAEALAVFAGECGALADARANLSDRDAVLTVQNGNAAFAVITGPLAAHERKAGVVETPFGVELFALACSAQSTLQSVSSSQMRKILSGEITDWSQLGQGQGGIAVYVPDDRNVAERAAKAMIPGDPFGARCTAVAEAQLPQALQQPNALGVVRLGRGPLPAGVKTLLVDWNPPTLDTFRAGQYRCGGTLSLATLGAPGGAAARFLAAARSHDGTATLARLGLVAP